MLAILKNFKCINLPTNVLDEHPICPICAHANSEGNIESAAKKVIPEDFFCCQMPSCFHYNLRKPNQTQIFASQMVNIESLREVLNVFIHAKIRALLESLSQN